jgi:hypothetical protein
MSVETQALAPQSRVGANTVRLQKNRAHRFTGQFS